MALHYLLIGLLASLALAALAAAPLPDFQSPPRKQYGPHFRYWIPDASIDVAEVVKDINALKKVGAGGFWPVPFYQFGFRGDPTLPSWNEFGYGSHAYKELFKATLEASAEAGISFNPLLGASQGQGVPAKPLSPGLSVQLVYGEATLPGGQVFEGTVPAANPHYNFELSDLAMFMHRHEDFGPNKLVAVVAGGVKSVSPTPDPKRPDHQFLNVVLDESTLVDLTESVLDGRLTWQAPSNYANYTLFALYERYSNQRSVDANENAVDIIGNGSWITDKFSATGAQILIDFWETKILDEDTKTLLRTTCDHVWEDGLEVSAALYWSESFLERFKTNRGYNPAKYLPLMFHQSNTIRAMYPPYNKTYILDSRDPWQSKFLQDYRLTLSEGNMEYLETFEKWANSLNFEFGAQVGYNLPLDMSANVPTVGLPQLESLLFLTIDVGTQYTGAAHLSGRNLIASEVGAVFTGAYSQPSKDLVALLQDAFAIGVNRVEVHSGVYGGEYNSTWPGYTTFGYGFTEHWGPRLPDWQYMNDSMAYTARNQQVLQTGVPKKDVVFYKYAELKEWPLPDGYSSADLRSKGYSYEYLGPTNLASAQAVTVGGILAPQGPAYRALVFNNQTYISPEAAKKVLEYAESGLAILSLGSLPNITIGVEGQDIVSRAMNKVATGFDRVKFLDKPGSLAIELIKLGVKPRVSLRSGGSEMYSVWRSTDTTDFVYLFNKGDTSTFDIIFDVDDSRVPYRLDTWTGHQSEVAVYKNTADGLAVSTILFANQTAIFSFIPSHGKTKVHVTSHSDNIEKVERSKNESLLIYIKDNQVTRLKLSDGEEKRLPGSTSTTLPQISVDQWDLTLESWEPHQDPAISQSAIRTIPLGLQTRLVPWSTIPEVRNISGVGIYTANFSFPGGSCCHSSVCGTAVIIHFGPVLNTLRAWVNNRLLPPVDVWNAMADISGFLVPGTNSIRVETSSSLFNAVKVREDLVKTWGQGPMFPFQYTSADFQPYGLIGPVTLTRLRKAVVDLADQNVE